MREFRARILDQGLEVLRYAAGDDHDANERLGVENLLHDTCRAASSVAPVLLFGDEAL